MKGKIYASILNKIEKEGAIHACLIDPDESKQSIENAGRMAALADQAGTDLFFIGGSTAFDQTYIDKTILEIKKNSTKPVIIFHHTPSVKDFYNNKFHDNWPKDMQAKWQKIIN